MLRDKGNGRRATPMTKAQELRELADRVEALESIIRDTLWMAGRYADGRMTYAVGMFNDARAKALSLGVVHDVPAAFNGTPGGHSLASQTEGQS